MIAFLNGLWGWWSGSSGVLSSNAGTTKKKKKALKKMAELGWTWVDGHEYPEGGVLSSFEAFVRWPPSPLVSKVYVHPFVSEL
jgi:hypothetical protein